MLAEVRPKCVFKEIDPAVVVPEEKSEPSRALICILATLLGAFVVVMRHYASVVSTNEVQGRRHLTRRKAPPS